MIDEAKVPMEQAFLKTCEALEKRGANRDEIVHALVFAAATMALKKYGAALSGKWLQTIGAALKEEGSPPDSTPEWLN